MTGGQPAATAEPRTARAARSAILTGEKLAAEKADPADVTILEVRPEGEVPARGGQY